MDKASHWLGFLEIGDKSTAVIRAPELRTGKPDTIYLFNLKRNEIIEYKRDIVEAKLRELSKAEAEISKELKKAFNKATKEFTPRTKARAIPDKAPSKQAMIKKQKEETFVDFDMYNDSIFDEED